MSHGVSYGSQQVFEPDEAVPGLAVAPMVGAATGSVHLELSRCRLDPGRTVPGRYNAFEESWYLLAGSGVVAVGDLAVHAAEGAFGVVPVATPYGVTAGEHGLEWLRVRAPQPRPGDATGGVRAAEGWVPSERLLVPSETDPRVRWAGRFEEDDMGPPGPLNMPGYHGPNIKSIFVRMLVDELLGARHHTLFMVEFGARAVRGKAASEHYHPFEEAYFLLAGAATGTLDGETVEVAAGDVVWTSVNGTHGFVNDGDVPVRWLEVQAPVPPASDAFFFPADWRQ